MVRTSGVRSSLALVAVMVAAIAAPAAAQPGVRLLVLDAVGGDAVSDDEVETVRTLVTDALRGREGLLVATSSDVRKRAPLQADRASSCNTELCLHELADLLDADFVLFGDVRATDEGRVVRLGVFEEKSGEIVGREEVAGADVATLAPFVGAAMERLLEPVLAEAKPSFFETPLFLLGAGVTTAGLLVAAGAGGWALELDNSLSEPSRHRDIKRRALEQGPLLLAVSASGGALALVGGALLLTAVFLQE